MSKNKEKDKDEIKEYGFDVYDSVKDCIDDLMKNA